MNGNYVDALSSAQTVAKLNSKSPDAYFLMAQIGEKTLKYDEAIDNYMMAISLNPSFASAYLSLGNLYLKKGDTEIGNQYRQKAFDLDPKLKKTEK